MIFKAVSISLLLIITTANGTLNGTNQDHKTKYLQQSSILFALSTFAQNEQINQECSNQLEQLKEQSLNKSAWAMKMLDASGRSLPGFLFGQNFWLGDRQICEAVQRPLQKPLQLLQTERHKHNMHWGILNETAPYDVGFSVAYLEHTSPWQVEIKYRPSKGVIQIGLCVPAACKVADLKLLIEQFLKISFNDENDFYELNAKLLYVKQPNSSWLLSKKFLQSSAFTCLACLTTATLLLMLTTAIFGQLRNEKRPLCAFLKCFDLVENARKIFHIKNGKEADDIPVISGLRVVVSIGIVSIHLFYFTLPVVTNHTIAMAFIDKRASLFLHIVVDFFFTISGFLQANKFLNSPQQLKSIAEASALSVGREFLKKIFHRWLRLAPLFYTIVCVDVLIVIFIKEVSVYHILMRDEERLPLDWWSYLIFIHNFASGFYIIANWTWSMGCEMQFFIVGTLLLLIYAKKPNVGKVCFLVVLAANFGFYYYNGIRHQFGFNHDDFIPNARAMYVNPLVRCTPYLLGILCGWYLAVPKKRLSAFTERFMGNASLAVFVLLFIILTYCEISPGVVSISILIVGRLSMSLCTCLLIVAGVTNRKICFRPILELSFFQPLARLSYAFYLVHTCIIIFVAYTTNTGLHLDGGVLFILYLGFVLAGYVAAVIGSLIYEIPFCNLSNYIAKGNFKKTSDI